MTVNIFCISMLSQSIQYVLLNTFCGWFLLIPRESEKIGRCKFTALVKTDRIGRLNFFQLSKVIGRYMTYTI